jgi:hypothetical protein
LDAQYEVRLPMRCWTAEEILEGLRNVDLREVEWLCDAIGELLARRHPGVQSCALAEALATYLCGHDSEARELLLEQHIKTVRELIVNRD